MYQKQKWKDHYVQNPLTYLITKNDDGTTTLTPAFGEVIVQGTPLDAEHLNHMEEGIGAAVRKDDIKNDLLTSQEGYALDARQGKVLGDRITRLSAEAARTATYAATLTASGWSASAPYQQTVSAEGILATDDPFVDVDMSGASGSAQGAALTEAWGFVGRVTAGEGQITAYCYEDKPAVNLPVILKVVR